VLISISIAVGLATSSMLGPAAAGAQLRGAPAIQLQGGCGDVVLYGGAWLGGGGVDVFSNGSEAGTGNSCGGVSHVNGVVAGQEWQCVELVVRLYLTRGWISNYWNGNGADLYRTAPPGLARQPQGSISFLSPGDAVSYQSTGGVEPGHAGVVSTVTPLIGGGEAVTFVNQNGHLFTSGTLWNGRLTMFDAWIRNFPVVGVIHHPGAHPPPFSSSPSNLLRNGSFERNQTAGWSTLNSGGGTVSAAPYRSAAVPEGGNYLEFNTSRPFGSVFQDTHADLAPGQSYTFSMWVRARSRSIATVCAVLWGLGTTAGNGTTCRRVGRSWKRISAPYDVSSWGLSRLRAQVFLLTTNIDLDITGASVVSDGLANATFEGNRRAGWSTLGSRGGRVSATARSVSGVPEGGNVLEFNTSQSGGSVYQDVPMNLVPNQSYTFSVLAKARATTIEHVCVVLWGIGATTQNGTTCARVGTHWKRISVPYDVSATGLWHLRAQVYLLSTGVNLDIAGTSLVNDGLSNGSFERNHTFGWSRLDPPGGRVSWAPRQAALGLPGGDNFLEFNTSLPGGSVFQDTRTNLVPNQSYTFSVWARARATSPEKVCVVLWGTGFGIENGTTCATVGRGWTLIAAPFDVGSWGLTHLRAQVYLLSKDANLDITRASLAAGP